MNSKVRKCTGTIISLLFLLGGCGSREVTVPGSDKVSAVPEVIGVEQEKNIRSISPPPLHPRPAVSSEEPESPPADSSSSGNSRLLIADQHRKLISERLAVYRAIEVEPGPITDAGFSQGNFYFIPSRWQQCRADYDSIVNKYADFDVLPSLADQGSGLAALYREDFQFYSSSECRQLLSTGITLPSGRIGGMEADQVAAQLKRQVLSRRFEEALVTFEKLLGISGYQQPSVDVLDVYVDALLRSGRVEEATEVYRQIVARLSKDESDVRLWRIQGGLADLLLVSGRQQEARKEYEQLVSSFADFAVENNKALLQLAFLENGGIGKREINDYLNILKGKMLYSDIQSALRLARATDDFQRRYPFSPVIKRVKEIQETIEKQMMTWTGEKLQKVDELIEQQRFDQARAVLKGLSVDQQPFAVQEVISKTMDDVVVAEARQQEQLNAARIRERLHQWTSATYLLDSRQFDQAINGYRLLFGTGMEGKARDKIQECMNAAANNNRKEAANLYIRATRTSDPEQKTDLLLASRQLLKDILDRYPQADLIDKVNQNLDVLESQIKKIDPDLLEKPVSSEQ